MAKRAFQKLHAPGGGWDIGAHRIEALEALGLFADWAGSRETGVRSTDCS
jgi:hypothetical protein